MSRGTEDEFRSISLFRDLDDTSLADLMKASFIQTFPPEVTLIWAGTAVTFVHAVLSGEVELSASHAGRQYTMMLRSAGTLLPLNHLVGEDRASCEAQTATRARVAMIPVVLVRALVQRHAWMATAVMRELSALNEALIRQLHSRNLQKSHERLATWIYEQLADTPEEQEIELVFHKKLLAAAIGISQATLSRDIEALEAHGVTVRGRRIHVRSRSALAKAANPIDFGSSAPSAPAAPWTSRDLPDIEQA